MRGKILISVIITVVFALLSATSLFVIIANNNEVEKTTESLGNLNNYVKELNIRDPKIIEDYTINGVGVRCTFIDKDGKVIYDTYGKLEENHLGRAEVQDALKTGKGHSVRSSDTTRVKTVYYASLLDDGTILRTSIPFETVIFFNYDTMIYWIVILVCIFTFSVFLSTRLVKTIVGPLKDLENVTAKIANGDLHIRANEDTGGEIGSLAKTFNNMTEQLQNQINQVVDKQNRLESILSCMESGVIAVNRRDEVIIINPYARRIFGIRREIAGEKISNHIKDYDINNFLNGNEGIEKEIKLLHPVERVLRIKKQL